MSKFAVLAFAAVLVVQPALAAKKQQPQQAYAEQPYVEDVSDSSGNHFDSLRLPNRLAPSQYKQYCFGGFQQCAYDSMYNHSDPNPR
jgi:hypothetical protein